MGLINEYDKIKSQFLAQDKLNLKTENQISSLPQSIPNNEFLLRLEQLLKTHQYNIEVMGAHEILSESHGNIRTYRGNYSISFSHKERTFFVSHNVNSTGDSIEEFSRLEAERLIRWCLALIFALNGNIVLHGNVLSFEGDTAIAILGESGNGKSTLSLSLAKEGARFLADDLCVIERDTGRIIYQDDTLNLSSYTLREIGNDFASAHTHEKLSIKITPTIPPQEVYYLKRIYKLKPNPSGPIATRKFSSAEGVYELMKCAIIHPRELGESMADYWENRMLLFLKINFRQLQLPRDMNQLSKVCKLLLSSDGNF